MIRNDMSYGTAFNNKVWVMREFKNAQANHLGMPLPAGRVRFYRQGDFFLFVRRELHTKFDGLGVGLGEGYRGQLDFPCAPTIQVFDHADFDRLLLVIPQRDLK